MDHVKNNVWHDLDAVAQTLTGKTPILVLEAQYGTKISCHIRDGFEEKLNRNKIYKYKNW